VDIGARVPAFLHFMDHPDFPLHNGEKVQEWIEKGQRVRVWVKDVDEDLQRLKVTGVRPTDLPVLGWD
jgi:ribosomal protein S1